MLFDYTYIIRDIHATADALIDERAAKVLTKSETLFEGHGSCVNDAVFQIRDFTPHFGKDGFKRQEIGRHAGLVIDRFAVDGLAGKQANGSEMVRDFIVIP